MEFFWTYIVICTINSLIQDNILTLRAIRQGIQNRMVKHLYRDARKISSSKETFAFQINKISYPRMVIRHMSTIPSLSDRNILKRQHVEVTVRMMKEKFSCLN